MKIEMNNGKAEIYTPYNPEFVRRIKMIGNAKWTGKAWSVPEAAVEEARAIMLDVYGETDVQESEKVKVKLTFSEEVVRGRAPIVIYGKTIASARGRDSGARIGEDVAIIKGAAKSDGSAKNWCTVITEGTELTVDNVPASMLDEELPEGVTAEVMPHGIDKEALLKEKERLEARLAEIEKLLAE